MLTMNASTSAPHGGRAGTATLHALRVSTSVVTSANSGPGPKLPQSAGTIVLSAFSLTPRFGHAAGSAGSAVTIPTTLPSLFRMMGEPEDPAIDEMSYVMPQTLGYCALVPSDTSMQRPPGCCGM